MSESKGAVALRKICERNNVKFEDVDAIFSLYGSNQTEKEIEQAISLYPEAAQKLAAKIFLGIGK